MYYTLRRRTTMSKNLAPSPPVKYVVVPTGPDRAMDRAMPVAAAPSVALPAASAACVPPIAAVDGPSEMHHQELHHPFNGAASTHHSIILEGGAPSNVCTVCKRGGGALLLLLSISFSSAF